jgi:carbonic anhydrase
MKSKSDLAVVNVDEALQQLIAGNQRYVNGSPIHPNQTETRRLEVAKGQKPFAAILCCADSRVPPEIIFDQGLGDLFVVRTAGQVTDKAVLGSLEFAVQELHITLMMVLGHARCGAVIATIEAIGRNAKSSSDIGALVEGLRPAFETVKGQPGDLLDKVVKANVVLMVDRLKHDPILAEAVEMGQLRIVGALYDLDTGIVEVTVL